MTVLNLQQLIKRLKAFETEIRRELKAHHTKINSMDVDDLGAMRQKILTLQAQVARLERKVEALEKSQ